MNDELMNDALCWEWDGKVSAEYAHTRASLTYHCPDKSCLTRVVPAKRNNYFFRAPDRHIAGCKNEKEVSGPSVVPGISRPRPSPLLPPNVPTYLGSGPTAPRRQKPTPQELRQLAERAEQSPILHPGTFREVVDAWANMNSAERGDHPLFIADRDASYRNAFTFLPQADLDIARLACRESIIFGAADIELGTSYFFVRTVKRFMFGNKKLQISVNIRKDSPAAAGLAGLVGESVTVFWHGAVPVIDARQSYFSVRAPDQSLYDGAVVKRGHLLP